MKTRKLFVILYFVLALVVILTASTLAKYTSGTNANIGFEIGNKLYFKYDRSNLYRNDKLIIGTEVEFEQDGEIVRRIETMNVVPGDGLKYHFFVSNFNTETNEENGIEGTFRPISNAIVSLPIKQQTYDIDCIITYRAIPLDANGNELANNTNQFATLTSSINLPKASEEKVKYEFQISIILDDQITNTSSDDYFGASLNIYLFINGASNL